MLRGDVYDGNESAALIKMHEIIRQVEQSPNRLRRQHLGALRAPSRAPMV
jgi:FADH2 O2-dependent halogenase